MINCNLRQSPRPPDQLHRQSVVVGGGGGVTHRPTASRSISSGRGLPSCLAAACHAVLGLAVDPRGRRPSTSPELVPLVLHSRECKTDLFYTLLKRRIQLACHLRWTYSDGCSLTSCRRARVYGTVRETCFHVKVSTTNASSFTRPSTRMDWILCFAGRVSKLAETVV